MKIFRNRILLLHLVYIPDEILTIDCVLWPLVQRYTTIVVRDKIHGFVSNILEIRIIRQEIEDEIYKTLHE